MPTPTKVKGIKYGTMAQYNAIASHDPDMLYFITDKGLLYRGQSIVVPRNYTTHTIVADDNDHTGDQVTFNVETYGPDPENPDVLQFTVCTKAAVNAITATLTQALAAHAATTADDETYGHVRLYDHADSSKDADSGYAATPKAVADAIADAIGDLSGAMIFKGTIGAAAQNPTVTELPATPEVGDTYRVVTAGSYGGHTCEPGDMIICVSANPADWTVAQNNLDGAVTAAADLTADQLVLGNGGRTAKTLAAGAGNSGRFLRVDSNGKPVWYTLTNVEQGQGHASCSTAAATAAKTALLTGYTLLAGGIVAIRFANAVNTGATLNISSTGAKAIYHRNAAITGGVILAGDTVTFMYDGIRYHVISIDRAVPGSLSELTNDIIASANSDGGETNGRANVVISGFAAVQGSILAVTFQERVLAECTLSINGGDPVDIMYHGALVDDKDILSGDTATLMFDGRKWHVLAIDRKIDSEPVAGSANLITSGAVYAAIQDATLFWEEM